MQSGSHSSASGSGVFMSADTAAVLAAVPATRRSVASGARTMLQNMGALLSISFVMAVITSAVLEDVLLGRHELMRPAHVQEASR